MYPNVTLEIKNNVPSLIYYPSETESRKMTLIDENLGEIILNLAQKLDLNKLLSTNDNFTLENLFILAREADETYVVDFPDMELEGLEFALKTSAQKFLNEIKIPLEYVDVEMAEDVREELVLNTNLDYFASLLEYLYMIMIGKALIAASELGVGVIRLNDHSKNTRLQEKMSMELERMGVDFIVE